MTAKPKSTAKDTSNPTDYMNKAICCGMNLIAGKEVEIDFYGQLDLNRLDIAICPNCDEIHGPGFIDSIYSYFCAVSPSKNGKQEEIADAYILLTGRMVEGMDLLGVFTTLRRAKNALTKLDLQDGKGMIVKIPHYSVIDLEDTLFYIQTESKKEAIAGMNRLKKLLGKKYTSLLREKEKENEL